MKYCIIPLHFLYKYIGTFKKYNKAAKYLNCIEKFQKWKKLKDPQWKKPKMLPLTMSSTTRVIYLVHDHLDLAILSYMIV